MTILSSTPSNATALGLPTSAGVTVAVRLAGEPAHADTAVAGVIVSAKVGEAMLVVVLAVQPVVGFVIVTL
jgi:hypothetical protein